MNVSKLTKCVTSCIFLILCTSVLHSQGVRLQDVAYKTQIVGGQIVIAPAGGATITVCTIAGTGTPCTPQTTCYTSQTLATHLGSCTLTADSKGNYGTWLSPNSYVVTITGTGLTAKTLTYTLPVGSASSTNNVQAGLPISSFDASTQSLFGGVQANQIRNLNNPGSPDTGFVSILQDNSSNNDESSILGYFRDTNSGGRNEGSGVKGYYSTTTIGTVTNADGIAGYVENTSTGTVTNANSFHALAPVNNGGGTITNAIGLLCDLTSGGAGSTNYCIKTGTAQTLLGGALTVTGNAIFNGTATFNSTLTFTTLTVGTLNGVGNQTLLIQSTATSGNAGPDLRLIAANGGSSGGNTNGGNVVVESGTGTNTGNAGNVTIATPLNAGGSPGNIILTPGAGIFSNGNILMNVSVGQGTAFKHGRVTTGSINGTTAADVTLNWTGTAFSDTSYTATCTVLQAAAGAATNLSLTKIKSKAAGSIVVSVYNGTGGALTGEVNCIAVHD